MIIYFLFFSENSIMFQQSDVTDVPVPPVGPCQRDLNAEACDILNCYRSGRGKSLIAQVRLGGALGLTAFERTKC